MENTKQKVQKLLNDNSINPNNFKELSQTMNIPYKTLKWYYYKLRTTTNPTTNTPTTTKTIIPRLSISIKEVEGDLYLRVKTCKEFEDFLKDNKELCDTTNLFNEEKTGKYYRLRFTDRYTFLDNINRNIFYEGRINFSILRVKGISKGLDFKINGLLPESLIVKQLKSLVKTFKEFYKKEIEKIPININGEVLTEITQKEVLQNE